MVKKGTFSISALARLIGISQQGLSKNLSTAHNLNPSKLVETLTQYGVDAHNITEYGKTGIPDIAASLIVGHYAMYAGDQ